MPKTIFLTGSSGFIGKNLSRDLSSDYQLLSPTHRALDLTNFKKVKSFIKSQQIDLVIHTANIGGTKDTLNKPNLAEINLRMFFNLVCCKSFYKHLIYFGSGAEFDKNRHLIKIKETDFGSVIPQDSYGFYKYICFNFAQTQAYITNLRLFAVFGEHEDYKFRLISNLICKALFNLPLTLYQNAYFDFLDINDLSLIVRHFIDHKPKYKSINLGSGQSRSLKSIAKTILKLTSKDLPIKIKKPGINKQYTPDISRLKNQIPSFKNTDFKISLMQLINYYRTNLPKLNKKIFHAWP